MAYPGVYRAKAARLDGSRLTAYVPQVFGEQPVTVVDFVGGPPTDAQMGWVSFHGGHPEHPVWLGTGIAGGGGTGTVSDVVWVGTDPPPDPSMELWWDSDEPAPAAWVVLRNTTANRPTPTAADVGVMYMDNTLNANGKPIWWNGTAWVDATGTIV